MFYGTPPIVTNGLVLNLDCGNRLSYPTSGTTWTDLSGFANNGTLTNGPTFNPNNLGSIVFDGVDDYISINESTPGTLISNNTATVSMYVKVNSLPCILYAGNSTSNTVQYYSLLGVGNNTEILTKPQTNINSKAVNSSYDFSQQTIINLVFTSNYNGSTTSVSYFVNGTSVASDSFTGGGALYLRNFGGLISPFLSPQFFPNCNIYNVQIYNRILSTTEILQNFNALKGRYGIN